MALTSIKSVICNGLPASTGERRCWRVDVCFAKLTSPITPSTHKAEEEAGHTCRLP